MSSWKKPIPITLESLVLFDSVVNSGWFMRTPIILMLCNVAESKAKLGRSPLQNYFPDYSGGNDAARAAKYLLWRFNHLNRAQLNLYPILVEPSDTTTIKLLFAAVELCAYAILPRVLSNGIVHRSQGSFGFEKSFAE